MSRVKNVSIGLYGPLQPHGGWQGAREEYPGQSRGDKLGEAFPGLEKVYVVWKSLSLSVDVGRKGERVRGRDTWGQGDEVRVVEARTGEEECTRQGLERGIREGWARRGVLEGRVVWVHLGVVDEDESSGDGDGPGGGARINVGLWE